MLIRVASFLGVAHARPIFGFAAGLTQTDTSPAVYILRACWCWRSWVNVRCGCHRDRSRYCDLPVMRLRLTQMAAGPITAEPSHVPREPRGPSRQRT